MSSLLILAALSGSPAFAAEEAPLAIPAGAADFTPAADPIVDISTSPSRRAAGAQSWTAIGIGAGFGVWTQPGRPGAFLLGDHLELELGRGGSSIRARLSTLRVGEAYIGGEIGALALHAFGDDPSAKGLYVGVEGASAWSMLGRRVLAGAAIGWRGAYEGRLTASLAYTPGTYRAWTSLRSPTTGVHLGFTLTAMSRRR